MDLRQWQLVPGVPDQDRRLAQLVRSLAVHGVSQLPSAVSLWIVGLAYRYDRPARRPPIPQTVPLGFAGYGRTGDGDRLSDPGGVEVSRRDADRLAYLRVLESGRERAHAARRSAHLGSGWSVRIRASDGRHT